VSARDKLPYNWEWTTVGEISVSIRIGYTAKADNQAIGPRFLRITDIQDGNVRWEEVPYCEISDEEIERYRLKDGDLVFARTGSTTGKSYLVRDCPEAVFASFLIRVRPATGVDSEYVYNFCQSPDYWVQIESGKRGIGQQNINTQFLRSIKMPLAPFAEQRRIVAELKKQFARLDDCTNALHRVSEDLKKYRAAILKAACEGRLVPTEVELARDEGREYEPASALLERILAERRAGWEANQFAQMKAKGKAPKDDDWKEMYVEPEGVGAGPLENLPPGWVWVSPAQIGEIRLGKQRSPKNISKDHPTKYIRAANITEHELDLTDVMDMELESGEREHYLLRYGDILLSSGSGNPRQIGMPALWRDELPECCFQNTIIRLRPVIASSDFLLSVFSHYYFNKVFARIASKANYNNLSADRFSTIEIALPPLAEQHRIAAEVKRRLQIVYDLENLVCLILEDAGKLRRSILTRAFEGRLVPQDTNDESDSPLLKSIALERQSPKEASMTQENSPIDKPDEKPGETTPARAVIPVQDRLAGMYTAFSTNERLTVEDLFRSGSYSFDSKEDVEIDEFFKQLTKELKDSRLTLERDDNDDVFVKRSMA
jgi:type I restriction enzyme S subunit